MAQFHIVPDCVMHVGANDGQEVESYRQAGVTRAIYIEPIPSVFESLRSKIAALPGHEAYNVLCAGEDGLEFDFNVASNNGEASSILGLGNHALLHPDVGYTSTLKLQSTTVDTLVRTKVGSCEISLLVLDVQGAELMVLEGAKQTLKSITSIYCEVSDIALYDGGCTWPEIVDLLDPLGFKMKDMRIYNKHYGNAFFIRDDKRIGEAIPTTGANVAVNKVATQSSHSVWSSPGEAAAAVNGHWTGRFAFHTDHEKMPWWQVDLGASMAIDEILVFNRMDACSSRAYALTILIGEALCSLREVHAQKGRPFGGLDGHPLRLCLAGQSARYIKIQLTSEDALHLDQVEIYSSMLSR